MNQYLLAAVLAAAATCVDAGCLSFEEPAPGRTDGRVYYYVPEGIDLSRPVPLLVFLHGGDASSPDTAPGNYFSEERQWLMPDVTNAQEASINEAGRLHCEDVHLRLIPYYAWNHRGAGIMDVWLASSLTGLED